MYNNLKNENPTDNYVGRQVHGKFKKYIYIYLSIHNIQKMFVYIIITMLQFNYI